MKILLRTILLFAALVGMSNARAANCVPYSIPIADTVMACGQGLIGSKYKTRSLECPKGNIVESTAYDTSDCRPVPPAPLAVNTVSKCVVTPDACAALPSAMACPPGTHWTLAGSGVAHCVQDDPVCPWGTSLTHDTLGNPSCIANTCVSNKVLGSDGISCICPASLPVWNGSSCTAPVVSCVADAVPQSPVACGAGFSGTKFRTLVTSCPSGPYGAPSSSLTAYDTSGCTPLAVTCSPGSVDLSPVACGSGFTGTKFRTETTTCPSGPYGSPSVSTSGYDTSSCGCANGASNYPTCTPPVVCTPTSSTTSASCGSGFTGTKYTTTATFCPSGTSSTVDTSACGCANGALDYPTCSAVPADPKCPAEEWRGSFTTAYSTKKGPILLGYIYVGCYGPTTEGVAGEKSPMACGYVFSDADWTSPEGAPPGPDFVQEWVKQSVCKSGAWTK